MPGSSREISKMQEFSCEENQNAKDWVICSQRRNSICFGELLRSINKTIVKFIL